jgi:protein-S-isoprenylcysteine O-methyltransferase Ste14
VRGAGVTIGLLGLAVALQAIVLLSGRGRPQRGPRPAFVIAGPYRYTRNPMLAGIVLLLFGTAMASRSVALATVAMVAAVGGHFWVVHVEEPRLLARFGPAYAAYLRRVPRWLPRRPLVDDDAGEAGA